jgi:hypothetical protein
LSEKTDADTEFETIVEGSQRDQQACTEQHEEMRRRIQAASALERIEATTNIQLAPIAGRVRNGVRKR